MKIAIDGPAGAGKSTIARRVAASLGYIYIDTGAMYRALTCQVLRANVDPTDEDRVYDILLHLNLSLRHRKIKTRGNQVFIGETDVTQTIRDPAVSENVSMVASHKKVRQAMVSLQQRLANANDVVMDGRDIGTTVLPKADLKIFLHASVTERAKRRMLELERQGHQITIAELEKQVDQRDKADSTREVSPLRKADDAEEIDTTHLTIREVVDIVLTLVSRRKKAHV